MNYRNKIDEVVKLPAWILGIDDAGCLTWIEFLEIFVWLLSLYLGTFWNCVVICWWWRTLAGLPRPKSPLPQRQTQYLTTATESTFLVLNLEFQIPILSLSISSESQRRGGTSIEFQIPTLSLSIIRSIRSSEECDQRNIAAIWNSRIRCCRRSFLFHF